jgi:hypothetical protein
MVKPLFDGVNLILLHLMLNIEYYVRLTKSCTSYFAVRW